MFNILQKKNIYLSENGRYMFNFFEEIKGQLRRVDKNLLSSYNMVNLSGKILYVEGHLGLTVLSPTVISFKIKKGRVEVEGKNLFLSELSSNTLKIEGQIKRVEEF